MNPLALSEYWDTMFKEVKTNSPFYENHVDHKTPGEKVMLGNARVKIFTNEEEYNIYRQSKVFQYVDNFNNYNNDAAADDW